MGQIEFSTPADCPFLGHLAKTVMDLPWATFTYATNEAGIETRLRCDSIKTYPDEFGIGERFEIIGQTIKARRLPPLGGTQRFAPAGYGPKIRVIWGEVVGRKTVMHFDDSLTFYVRHILSELEQLYGGVTIVYTDRGEFRPDAGRTPGGGDSGDQEESPDCPLMEHLIKNSPIQGHKLVWPGQAAGNDSASSQAAGDDPGRGDALARKVRELFPRQWNLALDIIRTEKDYPHLSRVKQAERLGIAVDTLYGWVTRLSGANLMKKRR